MATPGNDNLKQEPIVGIALDQKKTLCGGCGLPRYSCSGLRWDFLTLQPLLKGRELGGGRGGSSLGSLSVSLGFSALLCALVQPRCGRQQRVPKQRMWPAGRQVGFAQLRPVSVPHWLMRLLLPQHAARAEHRGLAPDTASRHQSHTNL